jgi:hypothetical protein
MVASGRNELQEAEAAKEEREKTVGAGKGCDKGRPACRGAKSGSFLSNDVKTTDDLLMHEREEAGMRLRRRGAEREESEELKRYVRVTGV